VTVNPFSPMVAQTHGDQENAGSPKGLVGAQREHTG
jgi:hypothetical protein